MMSKVLRTLGLVAAVVLLAAPQMGWAQTNVSTGQIFGQALDANGAGLPGVAIEAKNADTGFTRRAITDAGGFYRLDLLPSGVYDVRADLAGFKSEVKRGVNVSLGSAVNIAYQMQPTAIEEEIVVTAEAPVIETTNPNVAASVGDEAIANLPLQGRDFTDFVVLTPGSVAADDSQQGGRGGLNLGARAIQNSFNIDGSNSQSTFFGEERGGTRPPFTFSQAAIKEFQVVKSSYNTQFNASGGVINAITKSGTNELHGEVFGYFRNESFVDDYAENEYSGTREITNFDQKQYGFALGGPIKKDKIHYFVSYDGQDFETPYFVVFQDFPTDRQAEWEALTGLDYEEETGEIPQTNDASVLLLKLDWQLSDSHLLTLRDNWSDQEGENLTADYSNTGRSNNGLEENSFNSFVASLNSVISDSMFNEAILQYAAEERPRTANNTSLPETGIYRYRASFGQNNFLPNFLDEDRIQLIDNFTYYMGDHTMKAGVNFDLVTFDDGFFRYGGGSYSFNEWEGEDYGLLDGGEPYSYTQSFSDYNGAVKFDTNYYTFYVQDEWRSSPNLTINYGLRYDYQEHDDPKETNPLYPATGQIPNDSDNFAPRIGFAWDLAGDGKQVLRGGAGYFYDNTPTLLDANAMLANGVRVIRVSNRCSYQECPTWPNRWSDIGELEGAVSDIFVYNRDFENPETWRVSLGYEREVMENFSVGADIIYSQTDKLQRKLDRNIGGPTGETTVDGRPVYVPYYYHSNYEDFDQIMEFVSDAEAEYRAIVIKARKRFSDGWMFDASYTWSKAEDNDSNERSVSSSSDFPEDQFNLDNDWGLSNFDVEHKFVASATYQLPYGFMVSGIIYIRSGFPYSAGDGRDLNEDGYSNERATIENEDGSVFHYGRNTFRQPYYRNMDLRLSKSFSFGNDLQLELIGEVFNVTGEDNWTTRNYDLVNRYGEIEDDFGKPTEPGDPRQYQIGLKFRF